MINTTDTITILPVIHGKVGFSNYLRDELLKRKFDCIAVELPAIAEEALIKAVHELPIITATVMEYEETTCFIPSDPCDPMIEGLRQGVQNNIAVTCIGSNSPAGYTDTPYLPDPYSIGSIGFKHYFTLCRKVLYKLSSGATDRKKITRERLMVQNLKALEQEYSSILFICGMEHFLGIEKLLMAPEVPQVTEEPPYCSIKNYPINPDHLYFCLGELPFYTGLHEQSRMDIFAVRPDLPELIKNLFIETREQFVRDKSLSVTISPHKIQTALNFLRNLTYLEKKLSPGLFEIIEAAKGVFGDSYAANILKAAKHYPYFNPEESNHLSIGINRIKKPFEESEDAINLFQDSNLTWKSIKLKKDPEEHRKKEYRYTWNPNSMCSHLPEDTRIENFNSHIKKSALKQLSALNTKSEEFSTSVKDGIDIRETLRNWHTGKLYVKEIPPGKSHIDTVIIIFDDQNDHKYPNQTVWFAEHDEESTLTFFGTDPLEDVIGPGIARARYGGLSLLYPPRPVANPFESPHYKSLTEKLVYGACRNAEDKNIAYVSGKKPGVNLIKIARKFKKNLIWMPFAKFSSETLNQLRTFHVLNDQSIRSIATRFIGF